MTLAKRLRESRRAIVGRWVDDVLATYGDDAAAAFRRQKDPFANPIGHRLREATGAIFEALLDAVSEEIAGGPSKTGAAMDLQKIRPHVQEVIKVRAVQEFSASEAVDFVFQLKDAIRAELGASLDDPGLGRELAELERCIDRIALVAFDVFVECRAQVYELRINEVKRGVSWIMEKMNARREEQR